MHVFLFYKHVNGVHFLKPLMFKFSAFLLVRGFEPSSEYAMLVVTLFWPLYVSLLLDCWSFNKSSDC